ncbi:MAG: hypothetical protein WCO86_03840, partial [Planctomycetota bacterium]
MKLPDSLSPAQQVSDHTRQQARRLQWLRHSPNTVQREARPPRRRQQVERTSVLLPQQSLGFAFLSLNAGRQWW